MSKQEVSEDRITAFKAGLDQLLKEVLEIEDTAFIRE